ncbi:dTDP-4-dehydrorhamnose reductase [Paenibacillus darwinianus]|uniref:dTDP-4-dehydrorhamnose reductase n=1 Tax=Paenibacillus darwinianus TaxID=1380763 RepID=A0A9W5W681_9BACL|nr:dTDP-4-dehydrorhamnose reductase [Paenibacillus darwinianus]EXX85484.1 dTDP-4-dehydrorhamnose reductase [Paenibacillus darwinianus]EXX85839.1 dTDP-4-dehydrorhamnose reductase [Paenibacillus darwinianus]EXX86049.1 dTDP-4-dehydrorhamnose reductase [Paenibacillus darwinianus]
MKILITGASGQLGRELVLLTGPTDVEIVGFGRDRLDITNLDSCRSVLAEQRPDAIIHCAAYTAVDQAESEPDAAFRVNASGSRNLAVAAEEIGARLCYVSTDYVFDGKGMAPYNEYDAPNPQTVYGKSKLAGEELVRTLCSRYFIVRTSWVYGKYGHNFVKTMLKLGGERDSLKVVSDQVGSPTYTLDLAEFLVRLVQTERYGTYHASNTGTCSWYEFAQAIFEESGMTTAVEPCSTSDFPRPAPRPAYSVMDHSALRSNGFEPLRHWREALRHYLQDCE